MSLSKVGYMIGGDLSTLVSSSLKLPPDSAMVVDKTIPHYISGPSLKIDQYPSCELTLFAVWEGHNEKHPVVLSLGFCNKPASQEAIDTNFIGLRLVAMRFPGKQQSFIVRTESPFQNLSSWGKRISKGLIIEEAHFSSFLLDVPYGIPIILIIKGGVVTRTPDSEVTNIPIYPYGCSLKTSTPRTLGLLLKIRLGVEPEKNTKTRDMAIPLRVIGKPVNGSPEEEINAVAIALKDSMKTLSLGRMAGLCLVIEFKQEIHPILQPFFKKLRIIINPLVNSHCDILSWTRGEWVEVIQVRPILFFGSGCGLFNSDYNLSMISEIKGFNSHGGTMLGDPILGEPKSDKSKNSENSLLRKFLKK